MSDRDNIAHELRDALRPFAELADAAPTSPDDQTIIYAAEKVGRITVGDLRRARAALSRLDAEGWQPPEGKRWQHGKRGSIVTEIGRGFAQCATGPILEMSPVVVYRHDEDGTIWVRRADEFNDGRFIVAPPKPEEPRP